MLAALPTLLLVLAVNAAAPEARAQQTQGKTGMPISERLSLPSPSRDGRVPLERTLQDRRTVREFTAEPLTLAEISQLLWSLQGVTGPDGGRTAPSAGALYPLEVYLAAGRTQNLAPGVYGYAPAAHALTLLSDGDVREALAAAAMGQQWVAQAAAVFVIGAVEDRATGKYGPRGIRFVHIEVGHAAQNALLQAIALGLNAGVVGAFDDDRVARELHLPAGVSPLYLMPIGHR